MNTVTLHRVNDPVAPVSSVTGATAVFGEGRRASGV